MEPEHQPWFRGEKKSSPFSLFTVLTSDSKIYHSHSCFPWTPQSLESFWGGYATENVELVARWRVVMQAWMGTIVVGGTGGLYIFPKLATGTPRVATLSDSGSEIHNVAWALNQHDILRPLIVFTVTSSILVYDVIAHKTVGALKGHGGPITSIAVHPTQPNLFCTTSRDFTARIYDLSLLPVQAPNNPHWPPSKRPSLAGPAHGLHMSEPEGQGIGQCVAVMVGGRSGGHRASVLCCAFHPSEPLIATGGVDRTVKIWRIPPSVFKPPGQPRLAREDKPLFSTDLLHKARVLTVEWLADDILASSSAPALMQRTPTITGDTYWEDGAVVVWRWLGFNRFFPPNKIPQKVMRGTASDWRNSESFKILSAYHVPKDANSSHVYRSLIHDPILLIPVGKVVRIFNISEFAPRTPPKFPLDPKGASNSYAVQDGDQTHGSTEGIRRDKGKGREHDDMHGGQGNSQPTTYPSPAPLRVLFDAVEGWEVVAELPNGRGPPNMPDIIACSMGFEGQGIVGIGQHGTLYIWQLKR